MSVRSLKQFSKDIHLTCFSCNQHQAIGVFNFDWEGLRVQICLCEQCASLNEERLAAKALYDAR